MSLVKIQRSLLCPYAAVKSMLKIVSVPPAGPTFLVPSSSGLVSLTHCSFTNILRQLLALARHNPQGFSGHSLQHGVHLSIFPVGFLVSS